MTSGLKQFEDSISTLLLEGLRIWPRVRFRKLPHLHNPAANFLNHGETAWRLGCQSPAELSLVFSLALSFYILRDLCPPCCHVSSIWKASAWYLVEAGNASKASFPALLPILCPELGESQKHFGGFLPKPCTCGKPRCFREYFSQLCCFARNLPCAVFMYSLKANGSNLLGGCILTLVLPGILIHRIRTDTAIKHSF